jgi:hypothetical protein
MRTYVCANPLVINDSYTMSVHGQKCAISYTIKNLELPVFVVVTYPLSLKLFGHLNKHDLVSSSYSTIQFLLYISLSPDINNLSVRQRTRLGCNERTNKNHERLQSLSPLPTLCGEG